MNWWFLLLKESETGLERGKRKSLYTYIRYLAR